MRVTKAYGVIGSCIVYVGDDDGGDGDDDDGNDEEDDGGPTDIIITVIIIIIVITILKRCAHSADPRTNLLQARYPNFLSSHDVLTSCSRVSL